MNFGTIWLHVAAVLIGGLLPLLNPDLDRKEWYEPLRALPHLAVLLAISWILGAAALFVVGLIASLVRSWF
ncbi:MAG: hypothetical protein AB9869_17775 [Verrucomicrobiia bacterium]